MFKYISVTSDFERAKEYFENELSYTLGPIELKSLIENDLNSFNLLDVRKYEDYDAGHIPYAEHSTVDELAKNLEILDQTKPTIVYCYCHTCHLAKRAAMVLLENYYPVIELAGGIKDWREKGFDIVKTDSNVDP